MFKYKYTGSLQVAVNGVGTVEPNTDVESETEINHPDFEPKGQKEETKKKEDK